MNLILPITKSDLEELIQQSFENFGTIFSSNLIDSLKNIGFHYFKIIKKKKNMKVNPIIQE